jgi:hypothetical protein
VKCIRCGHRTVELFVDPLADQVAHLTTHTHVDGHTGRQAGRQIDKDDNVRCGSGEISSMCGQIGQGQEYVTDEEVEGGHTWEAAALPESRVATTCCMSAEKCFWVGQSKVGVKVRVYGRGERAEGRVGLEKRHGDGDGGEIDAIAAQVVRAVLTGLI